MKEKDIINLIKHKFPESRDFIGDDCAYIENLNLLISTDSLIENIHFLSDIEPYYLGWKSLAVNISDIVAMAGKALYFTLALSCPPKSDSWLNEFFQGLNDCAKKFNVILIGGDLTGAEKISISISIFGMPLDKNKIAFRSNAKPQDKIIISGDLGMSAAGLWAIKNKKTEIFPECVKAHLKPIPKAEKVENLIKESNKSFSMMDLSDGLLDGLLQIAEMSNVSLEIELSKININKELIDCTKLANENIWQWILVGGEDYELLATVNNNFNSNDWTEIGIVKEASDSLVKIYLNGQEFNYKSFKTFDHF